MALPTDAFTLNSSAGSLPVRLRGQRSCPGLSLLQITREPARRERRGAFQFPGFFKQVRCARNDPHFLPALEPALGIRTQKIIQVSRGSVGVIGRK